MTVKDDTSAFLNALQAYWAAAECGEIDWQHQRTPPNPDVACEAAAVMAKVLAPLIGYREKRRAPRS
jgi:hypothetical protein